MFTYIKYERNSKEWWKKMLFIYWLLEFKISLRYLKLFVLESFYHYFLFFSKTDWHKLFSTLSFISLPLKSVNDSISDKVFLKLMYFF